MGWGEVGDAFGDFGGSLSDSFSSFGNDIGSALGGGNTMASDLGGGYADVTDSAYSGDGDGNGNSSGYGTLSTDESDKETALDLKGIQQGYADMLRGDYEYWRTNFKPFEDLYRSNVNDPVRRSALESEAMGFVDRGANNAYGRSLAQMNFQDRKYGIDLSPDERASRNRRLLLTKSKSEANNKTKMRQYLNLRNRQILSGGIR